MKKTFNHVVQLFLCGCIVWFACSEKKESSPSQLKSVKSDESFRHDSLIERAEKVLKQETVVRDTITKSKSQAQRSDVKKDEAPRVPETLPRVDVTLWSGMTMKKLDRLFAEFTLTIPPSIQYYGICERITFTFTDNTPPKGMNPQNSKLKEISCYLDRSYPITEALQAIGIAVVKEQSSRAKGFVESSFSNQNIARVRSIITSPTDSTTKKIIITYK